MSTQGGANSKGRGGARQGAGRPRDAELEAMVVELAEAFGSQGDARVNPDRIVDGVIKRGEPWTHPDDVGIRPEGIREACRLIARRHLADHPLDPVTRDRMETSLAERIRRAYTRSQEEGRGTEPWRTIEVGPADGIASAAAVFDDTGMAIDADDEDPEF